MQATFSRGACPAQVCWSMRHERSVWTCVQARLGLVGARMHWPLPYKAQNYYCAHRHWHSPLPSQGFDGDLTQGPETGKASTCLLGNNTQCLPCTYKPRSSSPCCPRCPSKGPLVVCCETHSAQGRHIGPALHRHPLLPCDQHRRGRPLRPDARLATPSPAPPALLRSASASAAPSARAARRPPPRPPPRPPRLPPPRPAARRRLRGT